MGGATPFENRLGGAVGSPQAAQSGLLAAQGGSTGDWASIPHVSALWGGSEAQFSLRCIGCCAAGRVIGHRLLCSVGTRAEGPTLQTLKLVWGTTILRVFKIAPRPGVGLGTLKNW